MKDTLESSLKDVVFGMCHCFSTICINQIASLGQLVEKNRLKKKFNTIFERLSSKVMAKKLEKPKNQCKKL